MGLIILAMTFWLY